MAVCKRPPVHLAPPRALQRLIKGRNSAAVTWQAPTWLFRREPSRKKQAGSGIYLISDRFVDQSFPRLVTQFWDQRGETQSLDDRRWERLECLGTSLQEDDSSISQTPIKQSKLTIWGPQPVQRPSCSDKVGQVIHQSGELAPTLPPSSDQSLLECTEPRAFRRCWWEEQRWLWALSGGPMQGD